MEKEIVILLLLMVLAIVTTTIALVMTCKKYQESICIHTKTGNKYRVLQECLMKYDGKWMNAIAYESIETNEMYVREYNDFVLNFKRLSEWKEN